MYRLWIWYNTHVMDYLHVTHESIPPFYDSKSQILILGSLPSIGSRKAGFYYAYRTNRFFKVLASLYKETEPLSTEERKSFLLRHHIALFDVIKECDIKGSSDSSIKNPVINDFSFVQETKISQVFTTGSLAHKLYNLYVFDDDIPLPSPSAANAQMSLDQLISAYSIILSFLKEMS